MGRKPTFTPRQDDLILEQAAAGRTNAEIAACVGRTAAAVKARLAHLGESRGTLAAQDGRIRELFAEGLPYDGIAAEVGISKGRVIGRCRAMGLKRDLDSTDQREAGEAWRRSRDRPRVGGPWHVEGGGPLAERFNAQQDEVWASGGPKPVRYRDGYFEGTFFGM